MGCECNDNRTLEQLLSQWLCDQLNEEPVDIRNCDWEWICNELTNQLDLRTICYDIEGNVVSDVTSPTGQPCQTDIRPDIEYICNEETGFYTQTVHLFDEDGNLLSTVENVTTIPCKEACEPAQESFLGDNASLTDFNEITIFIPKCCEVTYSTSAGSVTLPPQNGAWAFNTKFECDVQDFEISSAPCDVNNITTILTKIK